MSSTNEAAPIIAEYTQKKLLSTLGYSFNEEELTTFEAECYTLIANKFAEIEQKELKRKK